MARDKGKPQGSARMPTVYPKQRPQIQELSGRDVFTLSGVVSEKEARGIIDFALSLGLQHQSSRGPKYGEAFRDNDRVSIEDEAVAQQLYTSLGIDQVFGPDPASGAVPVGLNPNLRFYRYRPGQRFGRHIDESVELGAGRFTAHTLLVYLSSVPRGGETIFYKRGRRVAAVAPRLGTALLHRHWPDCLEHEGAAVLEGDKWILRSDVVYQRPRS